MDVEQPAALAQPAVLLPAVVAAIPDAIPAPAAAAAAAAAQVVLAASSEDIVDPFSDAEKPRVAIPIVPLGESQ
jgi:hypothetical protein